MGFRVWGLGFGVWGLGFRVWGLGFGVIMEEKVETCGSSPRDAMGFLKGIIGHVGLV